ncbi:MAG: glycosyltransferase [Asticcacaulis sp.]|nr:glycosyltransferase [Asticcacaulis sp.]
MTIYKGKVERVRDNHVEGWVAGSGGPPELVLHVDDRAVASAWASVAGNDGRSSFRIAVPPACRDGGVHKIAVKIKDAPSYLSAIPLITVINPGSGRDEPLPEPTPPPAAAPPLRKPGQGGVPVSLPAHMVGHMDGLRKTYVYGWIVDRDRPGPVELTLYVDNQPVTTALADVFRQDVKSAGTSDGRSGFHFEVPRQFWDDHPHRIDVRLAADPSRAVFVPAIGVFAPPPPAKPEPAKPEPVEADTVATPPAPELEAPPPAESPAEPVTIAENAVAGGLTVEMDSEDGIGISGVVTGGRTDSIRLRVSKHDLVTAPVDHDGRFSAAIVELLAPAYARDSAFALDNDYILVEAVGVDGECLAECAVAANLPVRLNVERMEPGRVVGWLVHPGRKDLIAEADLYVDGVRFATVMADRQRNDVVAAGLAERGGGFQFAPFNPGGDGPLSLRFARRHTRDFLPAKFDSVERVAPMPTPLARAYPHALNGRDREVTLIVLPGGMSDPVALRRETPAARRVLVIGDTAASLADAVEQAGHDDVVVLAPDVRVGDGWLTGLRTAAWSDPRIATATPVSNNGGAFSVPEMGLCNVLSDGFTPADQARLVRQVATGAYPRVPVGGTFCLYIRRDALDRVGFSGDLGEFFGRAGRAGLVHVLDDRTHVWRDAAEAQRLPAADERYPEQGRLMRLFSDGEAALGVRWRIRRALGDGVRPKPRVLYVISTKTGGTPQTNRDLMTAVAERYETWVMACDSRAVELFRFEDGEEVLVERIPLASPIQPGSHRSSEYDDAVAYLILRYAFELVHIRHLGWHGADLPKVCKSLGIPAIFSLHDFYTVCPSIKLLDQDKVFCRGACTATAGDCGVELWQQHEFPQLKNAFIHRWREIFGETFADCDAFVTTSPAARDLFRNVYPELAGRTFPVIPHGRTFTAMTRSARRPSPGEPLKILVPGNISPAKGSDLINAMIELDGGGGIEWHLLGDPGKVTRAANVVVHGLYKRDEFGDKVAAIAPHVGAVLSIWPETYCHTLTEMWACGVPVVGIDCGAVGERLAEHGGGWRLPLGMTAEEALAQLLALDGEDWDIRQAEVVAWQDDYAPLHDIHHMGVEYENLYKKLLKIETL